MERQTAAILAGMFLGLFMTFTFLWLLSFFTLIPLGTLWFIYFITPSVFSVLNLYFWLYILWLILFIIFNKIKINIDRRFAATMAERRKQEQPQQQQQQQAIQVNIPSVQYYTTASSSPPPLQPNTPIQTTDVIFCSICGTQNRENAQFCKKCGASIE